MAGLLLPERVPVVPGREEMTTGAKARALTITPAGKEYLRRMRGEPDHEEGEMAPKLRKEAKALADEIGRFDRQCARVEYMDTGEAWELMSRAQRVLRRVGLSRSAK